jgi:hypothetical protein
VNAITSKLVKRSQVNLNIVINFKIFKNKRLKLIATAITNYFDQYRIE